MEYLTDTHAHLNFDRFDKDRDAVINRALEAGISRILNPGIDLVSCKQSIELAEKYKEVYAAVGLHPNSGGDWEMGFKDAFLSLVNHPKVVAVGEIGLDYYWDDTPRNIQIKVFESQLEAAANLGLPVIIHNRDATNDTIAILQSWHNAIKDDYLIENPGVMHSFSSDKTAAGKALGMDFYVGITGPVTFNKADDLRDVVLNINMEKILIETDAPFLTPHPYRGKRNEPSYVRLVAEKIAVLRDLPLSDVAKITTENAKRLFRW